MANMETSVAELSFPLPHSPDTNVFIHLTIRDKNATLFLATASVADASGSVPMGSFVYALPNASLHIPSFSKRLEI